MTLWSGNIRCCSTNRKEDNGIGLDRLIPQCLLDTLNVVRPRYIIVASLRKVIFLRRYASSKLPTTHYPSFRQVDVASLYERVHVNFNDINTNLCANGKRKKSRENLWYGRMVAIIMSIRCPRGERTNLCTKMALWNERWQATSELTLAVDSSFRAEMSRQAPRVERRERELHRDGRRDLGPELEPSSYVVFV